MKRLAVLLVLAVLPSAIGADESDDRREAFTQTMATKVGQGVTVKGVVNDAKNGWYLMTDDGGEVYLESPSGEPVRRFEYLKNWKGKRFVISGTLAYREASAALRVKLASRREHFYLDTSKTVSIVRIDQGQ